MLLRDDRAQQIEQRLTAMRGSAPRRSPTVRALSAYAQHADCKMATLAFAAEVDLDILLKGTPYEAPFGQSPFAIRRGVAFERFIAKDGHAQILNLLRSKMGFAIADAKIADLREKPYPRNRQGMRLRADDTRSLVRQIVRGAPAAPNLIDGAVLQASIGGIPALFEADAVAARFGGLIHVGEVKSFPVVDGRADPDKLSAALDQVAVYILFAKYLVAEVGGDADLVSPDALIITPTNVGLKPTLSLQNVGSRIARSQKLLSKVPDVREIAAAVSAKVDFGVIADIKTDPDRRLETFHELADKVGTAYAPSCLSTCGNARACRERAFTACEPSLIGPEAIRLLPGVYSLQRAAELSDGAPASAAEREVAAHLARAGRLYNQGVAAGRRLRGPKGVAV